jgi:hypothetical protein
MIRSLLIAAAFAVAIDASGATLDDVKAALRNLHAKRPIHATYETKSSNVASGRFFDQNVTTSASVEARVDDAGLTIVYSHAMLDRAAMQRDAKKDDAKERVAEINATRVAEMLDFAPPLAALLDRAVVVEERAANYNGQPARLIVMNIRQREDPRVKSGHVDVKLDRLSLWIGPDSLPLAADRTIKFSAGILFLKADGEQSDKSVFVHRDDRLVVTRVDHTDHGSGMGQTSHNSETEMIRIEN